MNELPKQRNNNPSIECHLKTEVGGRKHIPLVLNEAYLKTAGQVISKPLAFFDQDMISIGKQQRHPFLHYIH
jgi:hypothetical protein